MFRQATRTQSKLRMTLDGPAGSGKTYTALRFAHALSQAFGGRIALIDTERGSASKYVGESPDGYPWQFDVAELTQFSPEKYTDLITMASKSGYSVLIIDSLSHAWEGVGGALEIKQKYGEAWSAWRHVTPIHNRMIDAILQSNCHVITTMRSRMEYVQEQDATGKTVIRKVGLSPVQRPGMEYEFDLVCDMDWAHMLQVSKSRCSAVADRTVERPGATFIQPVIEWLQSGDAVRQPEPVSVETPASLPPWEPAAAPAAASVAAPAAVFTLDQLVEAFGVEVVMEANGGQIPGTDGELAAIASKLGA